MHKIDRPTLVQRFWRSQCEGFRTGSRCFALTAKIHLQLTVNMVQPFVIPRVSLPSQNLEKLRKAVSWVSLNRNLQGGNNGFTTCGIRAVMVNRSAQVQTPAGLMDTESEMSLSDE